MLRLNYSEMMHAVVRKYMISDVGSVASRELVVGAVSGVLRVPEGPPGHRAGVAPGAWLFPPRS